VHSVLLLASDALTQIDPPGASNSVDFTLDALARNRTRKLNSVLADTYGYIGESETVDLLTRSSGTITSALSSNSDRVAVAQGSSFGWTLPDLHGSTAAMLSSAGTSVSDAFRYDPYGELAASVTTGPSTPWRFNGNLLLTDSGSSDLYDGGARIPRADQTLAPKSRPFGCCAACRMSPIPVRVGFFLADSDLARLDAAVVGPLIALCQKQCPNRQFFYRFRRALRRKNRRSSPSRTLR